jgi:hypothetical protein
VWPSPERWPEIPSSSSPTNPPPLWTPGPRTVVLDHLLDAARAGAVVIIASSDAELIDNCTPVITLPDHSSPRELPGDVRD